MNKYIEEEQSFIEKFNDTYRFSKRNLYQLSVGMFIILIGVFMLLGPFESSRAIFTLLGTFFTVTGAQLGLWALGVRSEFLGINYDDKSVLEKILPDSIISKAAIDLADAIENLKKAIDLNLSTGYHNGENTKRIDSIMKEAIALASTNTPQLSIVFLASQIESLSEDIRFDPFIDKEDAAPTNSLREESEIQYLFYNSYRKLMQIRNAVVHGRISISQADTASLIDSGVRLIRAALDIKGSRYNKY